MRQFHDKQTRRAMIQSAKIHHPWFQPFAVPSDWSKCGDTFEVIYVKLCTIQSGNRTFLGCAMGVVLDHSVPGCPSPASVNHGSLLLHLWFHLMLCGATMAAQTWLTPLCSLTYQGWGTGWVLFRCRFLSASLLFLSSATWRSGPSCSSTWCTVNHPRWCCLEARALKWRRHSQKVPSGGTSGRYSSRRLIQINFPTVYILWIYTIGDEFFFFGVSSESCGVSNSVWIARNHHIICSFKWWTHGFSPCHLIPGFQIFCCQSRPFFSTNASAGKGVLGPRPPLAWAKTQTAHLLILIIIFFFLGKPHWILAQDFSANPRTSWNLSWTGHCLVRNICLRGYKQPTAITTLSGLTDRKPCIHFSNTRNCHAGQKELGRTAFHYDFLVL